MPLLKSVPCTCNIADWLDIPPSMHAEDCSRFVAWAEREAKRKEDAAKAGAAYIDELRRAGL
jgi:acyl-CoA-binding protein